MNISERLPLTLCLKETEMTENFIPTCPFFAKQNTHIPPTRTPTDTLPHALLPSRGMQPPPLTLSLYHPPQGLAPYPHLSAHYHPLLPYYHI